MNRRGFLGALFAAPVAVAALPIPGPVAAGPVATPFLPMGIPLRAIKIGDTIMVRKPIRFHPGAFATTTPPLLVNITTAEMLERLQREAIASGIDPAKFDL